MTMFAYDAGGQVRWVKNAPVELSEEAFMGSLEAAMIEGVSNRTFSDALTGVVRSKEPFYGFCAVIIDGTRRRFEVSLNPHINDRILGVACDAGRHEIEDRAVRALSLELAHRTKNLMAVISSLATQTGRRFQSFSEFKTRFSGQIGALSHAHDAIASTGWDGAILERIVAAQVGYDKPNAEVTISGDALGVMLTPNAAQNIAMVLNDLAGCCAGVTSIQVEADLQDSEELRVKWSTPLPVTRDDLWLDLLTKVAPMTLDGVGTISEDEQSFMYVLTLGRDHFAVL